MSDPMANQGGRDVRSMMSMFSPTDVAAKVGSGDIRPDMTVGEFLQVNFGVSPDDPIQKLAQAMQSQVQTKDIEGKMRAMQGGAQPQPAPAQPQPEPGPGGMAGLMSKLQK